MSLKFVFSSLERPLWDGSILGETEPGPPSPARVVGPEPGGGYSQASRLESSYHISSDTPCKPEQQPQVSRETTQLNNRVNPSLKQYSFELHSQTYTDWNLVCRPASKQE